MCIASNGVPPSISKRVDLKVQCESPIGFIYIFKLLNLILVPPMMTVPSQLEGVYIGGKNINVFWWQYVFFKISVSWLSSLLNGISKNWTKSFHKFMTIYFWMSAGNISLRCKSEAFPASINYWVRGERLQTVTNSARYHILKHIKQDNRIAFFSGWGLTVLCRIM